MSDLDAVRAAIRPDATRVLWVETPSNPLMKITDIAGVAEIAQEHGVRSSSSTTPSRRRTCSSRLLLGADVVVHSTTKYLGGHSDVARRRRRARRRRAHREGRVPAVRGGRDLRSDGRLAHHARHQDARRAHGPALVERAGHRRAVWSGIPKLEAVYYPGLPDHPGHELAAKQMRAFGGMISVAVAGGAGPAKRFAESTHAVPARGVARRRRVARVLPVRDDARLRARHRARGAGERRAALGRASRIVADLSADLLGALDRL